MRIFQLFCIGGILSVVSQAQAGNLDAFYVSGEAAMQAGAVVATTSTGGSIWYNPAGMAHLRGSRIDVSVSGYAVRFGANVGFNSTLPVDETNLSILSLQVVPAGLALTRRFGKVGVGFGVFVPSQSEVALRTHLVSTANANGQPALEFGYDSSSRTQEYHAGPGFGWNPLPDLSLGASLLANYRTQFEATDVSASVSDGTRTSALWSHTSVDSVGIGLELVLGTQWRFAKHWSLGAVVRTPSLRIAQVGDAINTGLLATTDGDVNQEIAFEESFSIGTQILSPFRFHLGVAHDFGNFQGSLEGSLLLPFKNETFEIRERATYNARLGLRTDLNEFWSIGGGVFSDRSSKDDPEEFLQKQINYYGVTLGVEWTQSYGVYSQNKKVLAEPKGLFFGTAVSLSYAIGSGTVAGAVVGPSANGDVELRANPADVLAHEFTLHIASTLSE